MALACSAAYALYASRSIFCACSARELTVAVMSRLPMSKPLPHPQPPPSLSGGASLLSPDIVPGSPRVAVREELCPPRNAAPVLNR